MDKQQQRRKFTPEQKLQIVLESLQRDTTLEAVSKKYSIVSSVIIRWRKEFKQKAAVVFADKRNPRGKAEANGYKPGESPDELKRIIGDLVVQNDILKKVPGLLG
jgi:transposase